MTQLLFMDLDGTLVDSRIDIAVSLNRALDECGLKTLAQERIEAMVGWGAERLVKDAIATGKAEDFQRVFISFLKHYEENLLQETKLYPGAIDFLESLPDWRKAVVTNKPQNLSEKTLKGLKVDGFFEWVIGSDQLAVMKPDEKVLDPVRKALGGWEQGVVVGDSIVDIQLGQNAGLTTCILTHGFGQIEELEEAKPDYLVANFLELKNLSIFLK